MKNIIKTSLITLSLLGVNSLYAEEKEIDVEGVKISVNEIKNYLIMKEAYDIKELANGISLL